MTHRAMSGLYHGIKTAAVVVLSFMVGEYGTGRLYPELALYASLWAMISGVIVLQTTFDATWQATKLRIIGAFMGVGTAALYLTFFDHHVVGIMVCTVVLTTLASILRMSDRGSGAIVTAIVVISLQLVVEAPPVIGAGMRFMEAAAGAVMALLVSYAVRRGLKIRLD